MQEFTHYQCIKFDCAINAEIYVTEFRCYGFAFWYHATQQHFLHEILRIAIFTKQKIICMCTWNFHTYFTSVSMYEWDLEIHIVIK